MKPIVLLLPLKPLGQVLSIDLIHIEVVPARCSYSIRMKPVGALWSCLAEAQRGAACQGGTDPTDRLS